MRCIKGTFIARLQTEVVSGINSLPVASGGGGNVTIIKKQ